jgi:hypothetical protein
MRDALIRNQVIVGCVNSAPRDFKDALSHLAQLRERCGDSLRQIITERVTPAESLWHYSHRRPQGIKVVLEYD